MKAMIRILLAGIFVVALTEAVRADSSYDELIDKGRRGGFSRGHHRSSVGGGHHAGRRLPGPPRRSVVHTRQHRLPHSAATHRPRQNFVHNAIRPHVRSQARQQLSPLQSSGLRTNPTLPPINNQARPGGSSNVTRPGSPSGTDASTWHPVSNASAFNSQGGRPFSQTTPSSTARNLSSRVGNSTARPRSDVMTPVSSNATRPLADQTSRLNQAPSDSMRSNPYNPVQMPYGQLAPPADTNTMGRSPFPWGSVEPQVRDNQSGFRPVSSIACSSPPRSTSRSYFTPSATRSSFIDSDSQPQFRPSRHVPDESEDPTPRSTSLTTRVQNPHEAPLAMRILEQGTETSAGRLAVNFASATAGFVGAASALIAGNPELMPYAAATASAIVEAPFMIQESQNGGDHTMQAVGSYVSGGATSGWATVPQAAMNGWNTLQQNYPTHSLTEAERAQAARIRELGRSGSVPWWVRDIRSYTDDIDRMASEE